MRGISEERLKEIKEKMPDGKSKLFVHALITQCTELNAWQPIETAPHDRPILARIQVDYGIEIEPEYHEIQWMGKKWSCYPNMPTHWQELPKDPK